MRRVLLLIICCVEFTGTTAHAQNRDEGVDQRVRDSVSRALPFLEKEGVAWMEERNCMSCHHVPFLLWSHRAANASGLPIDLKKLAEWEEWSRKDSLSHRNLYRLQDYDLGRVDVAQLPLEIKEKLKPLIEQPFKIEADFVAQVARVLSEDELQAYQTIIMKTAERTPYSVDRAGGGLDVLGQLLLAGQGVHGEPAQSDFRDGMVDLISRIQLDDGSWTPGNQFATMRRWSLETANQSTTMWAILALAATDPQKPQQKSAIEKGVAYVRKQPASLDNREWLATRLLFESRFGSAEDSAALRRQLIAARNSDGGWGWEKEVLSDSLTTGLALYVLAKTASSDPAKGQPSEIQSAREWLLTNQQPDGSWLTPSRNITKSTDPERLKVRDAIYHYWGTAWAAIALLESLPSTQARNPDRAAH